MSAPQFYSGPEVAAALGLTRTQLHRLLRREAGPDGRSQILGVPAYKVGQTWRVPKRAFDAAAGLEVSA